MYFREFLFLVLLTVPSAIDCVICKAVYKRHDTRLELTVRCDGYCEKYLHRSCVIGMSPPDSPDILLVTIFVGYKIYKAVSGGIV